MTDYEDLAPKFKETLLTRMQEESPYWTLLGLEIADIKKGWAKVRLPFARKLVHPLGIAHGGAIFSAADSAVAMALIGLVERDETFTTVEMKINYLRPFDKGEIMAEARIIHRGGKTALGDVEVRNGDGTLIAKGLATYMILKKEEFLPIPELE
ncbi:MAG: PaaI family thioesterase [Deltaproteobacteria bacterium]|nr:PaaI family thioesterase [Deltaproteobacteria bacterium]